MSDYGRRNNTPGGGSSGRGNSNKTAPSVSSKRGIKVLTRNGVVNLFTDRNAKTLEALGELQQNGYASNLTPARLEDRCVQTIEGLGFTIVETEELSPGLQGSLKKFSLIGSTNVDETIQNSRIVDPDLKNLTPIKASSADKFKDQSDSFYDLDQEHSQMSKNKKESEKLNSKRVAIDVARKLTTTTRGSRNKMLDRINKRALRK